MNSSLSWVYIAIPSPNCLTLERQDAARAFSRACAKTGNRMAAKIAIIAITTRSSIRVNARTGNRFNISRFPPRPPFRHLLGSFLPGCESERPEKSPKRTRKREGAQEIAELAAAALGAGLGGAQGTFPE